MVGDGYKIKIKVRWCDFYCHSKILLFFSISSSALVYLLLDNYHTIYFFVSTYKIYFYSASALALALALALGFSTSTSSSIA
mmetsp:Transcript_20755/g.26855  ORF Transcript_20755/g.26855 Transcript_20755/m.26855 type:complete len:82 (+) Transcript_20755:161-406(+)